ncbi:MAG: 2-oxoacid:acceptor oxidoreductase family protein [Candidatus Cloacimonetes bacterium]|nr:2-oxoacid:acceptor oxidoreductase family protein [Candidatus Cloacimonadota bacterium]
MTKTIKYPGERQTTNGNQLVATTEALISEAGVYYPITPSTEQGEAYQNCFAKGQLNAFGESILAIETEGEHAAQGGAIAISVTGKRTVNFTSGQGIVYGLEQYYHAPGKFSTMVQSVGARALTKHALNVHCGHDDIYAAFDTGWLMTFAKDAQQAVDQALIIRKVCEKSLTPGMNIQDGFLTTHLERTFRKPETALIREYLGSPCDIIETPTEAQKILFGPTRRRIPKMMDLENPAMLGPVQNQEHYMNGVAARRNNFSEPVLDYFEEAYQEFGELTGRKYGLISEYKCDDADTVFVALGSAVENIEAAVDYLRETSDAKVGTIHVNVIRPFPEKAIIEALRGKKKVIVLERTDESLSPENPLTKEVRLALTKGIDHHRHGAFPKLSPLDPATEMPDVYSGVYGLGSRDFRPEGVLGAYEFAQGTTTRTDGKSSKDGERFFYVGIEHPYSVQSKDTPSLLPDKAIAVRMHSVGGWGMITTGKNLGEILGSFSDYMARRDNKFDSQGQPQEIIHISANPKYGSEKKGAPTNYFMVAAPERIRVNCDLRHVNVVLCCDPKIFTHTNPLDGLSDGGAFVWESAESDPVRVWQRIPKKYRKIIIEKNIQLYTLPGFDIAKKATDREDLQTRMQGNAFLGAFFGVSTFLKDNNIPDETFLEVVEKQYNKKFGRFGDAVVNSNMTVMNSGFSQVTSIEYGEMDAVDTSTFIGALTLPCKLGDVPKKPADQGPLMFRNSEFNKEYKAGLGYHQPSSVLASVGHVAAGSGKAASKYVSRVKTPVYLQENCTQCMECISVCPDTALPNTAQDISTIIRRTISNYVTDDASKKVLLANVSDLDNAIRARMNDSIANKDKTSFQDHAKVEFTKLAENSADVLSTSVDEVMAILDVTPLSYLKVKGIFQNKEKKEAGSGGLFSIFVSDLCKGCGACVEACGDHDALRMVDETEEVHTKHLSAEGFLDLLDDTDQKYLGLYKAETPEESKAAMLRYHLMQRSKYAAFQGGDGACAGCGEKAVLRSIATVTEAYMRPVFHRKAERLNEKAKSLREHGLSLLNDLKASKEETYNVLRRSILHLVMAYGEADAKKTEQRISEEFSGTDQDLVDALVMVLEQDAKNHSDLMTLEDSLDNGMSVMAMAAHTGCNTVYASTPPNNPHPYPWMNSLFQDGATVGWLIGESFIKTHAARSVIPERFTDMVLAGKDADIDEDDYYHFTHFSDSFFTDLEVMELPKVWVVGGDGGMGDIGFQNVSKVILQNRPNVNILMLNTQVYSNTGGQNSESSVMTGGFDMNQAGPATEGKLSEQKSIAESFMGGHGSPYLAQVSIANSASMYKAILDGVYYRGTSYIQSYTPCQPEHGIPDHASEEQALIARESRGIPEYVFNPQLGETYHEAFSLKGNPNQKLDWAKKTIPGTKDKYFFTPANWAFTEARFRQHHKPITEEQASTMIHLQKQLSLVTMDDIVKRKFLVKGHRAFIPLDGVYEIDYQADGSKKYKKLSRQLVVFCIERRKSWRLLQSKAGVVNQDYLDQKELIKKIDSGEMTVQEFLDT